MIEVKDIKDVEEMEKSETKYQVLIKQEYNVVTLIFDDYDEAATFMWHIFESSQTKKVMCTIQVYDPAEADEE